MGLRISEALGLRWGDVDWLGSQINVERAIVAQHVDTTKTRGSKKTLSVAHELCGAPHKSPQALIVGMISLFVLRDGDQILPDGHGIAIPAQT